jgi:hypothetical protein
VLQQKQLYLLGQYKSTNTDANAPARNIRMALLLLYEKRMGAASSWQACR